MAERSAKKLARLHRVRTIQLGLKQAEESAAQATLAGETDLRSRIHHLAAGVMPAGGSGLALVAAAQLRERLVRSADTADARVRAAEQRLSRAQDATRDARQDQGAIDKLIARAEAEAVARELRGLEGASAASHLRAGKRYDPC